VPVAPYDVVALYLPADGALFMRLFYARHIVERVALNVAPPASAEGAKVLFFLYAPYAAPAARRRRVAFARVQLIERGHVVYKRRNSALLHAMGRLPARWSV